ncbi:MAG: hypothetical protein ACRC47_17800, partial [Shewanella sp.]
ALASLWELSKPLEVEVEVELRGRTLDIHTRLDAARVVIMIASALLWSLGYRHGRRAGRDHYLCLLGGMTNVKG